MRSLIISFFALLLAGMAFVLAHNIAVEDFGPEPVRPAAQRNSMVGGITWIEKDSWRCMYDAVRGNRPISRSCSSG